MKYYTFLFPTFFFCVPQTLVKRFTGNFTVADSNLHLQIHRYIYRYRYNEANQFAETCYKKEEE